MMPEISRVPLLCDAIGHYAHTSAKSVALICGNDRLSWDELDRRTARIANGLASAGLEKGDKAALFMDNTTDAFTTLWGIIRGGYVVVLLNSTIKSDSLANMLANSDSRIVLTDSTLLSKAESILASLQKVDLGAIDVGESPRFVNASTELKRVDIRPEDSVTITYSSGTTGQPKGIEHTHSARLAFAFGFGGSIEIGSRHVTTLLTTPLYTNGTWLTMAPTMMRGGRIVLMTKFAPDDFLQLVEKERCTHTFAVPTQCQGILASSLLKKKDLSSLKVLMSAGQMLSRKMHEQLAKLLPHTRVYQAYGMTEGFGAVASPEDHADGKLGSVGKPFYLDEITILDEEGNEAPKGTIGELAAWSGGMMKSYYNDPERTEDAFWRCSDGRTLLKSGDLGYFDDDGFLYIAGRLKDTIKSGGINVFAADLEAVLLGHPDVKEAAVIAVPHEKWMETPLAAVILSEGATVSEDDLKTWANKRLAKYQRISVVEFHKDFPRSDYGKVNKTKMREPFWYP